MNVLSIIPQLIIILALGGIAIIVVRRIPDLKKKKIQEQPKGEKRSFQEIVSDGSKNWSKWLKIRKKKLEGWLKTFKIRRTKGESSVDMGAESNIQTLQKSEQEMKQQADTPSKRRKVEVEKKKPAQQTVQKGVPHEPQEYRRQQPMVRTQPTMPVRRKKIQPPVIEDMTSPEYLMAAEKSLIAKIMRNPKDVNAYKELADIYAHQENLQDAIRSLREVLKLNPNDLMAEEKLDEFQRRANIKK